MFEAEQVTAAWVCHHLWASQLLARVKQYLAVILVCGFVQTLEKTTTSACLSSLSFKNPLSTEGPVILPGWHCHR